VASDPDWVDTREAADIHRLERRRRLTRSLLPVFYLLALAVVALVIARSTYLKNRKDAVALSDTFLEVLAQQITSRLEKHLSPATEMVKLASGIYQAKNWGSDAVDLFETLGMQFLKVYPQIQSFQIGIQNGSFLMTRRMPDGAVDTKIIKQQDGGREVRWVRRDPAGKVRRIEYDPDDRYDPRDSPWYKGAVRTHAIYWTDVYVFFTGRAPGVTAALAVFDADNKLLGVLSIDLELASLSRFLAGLRIGETGSAFIISETGQLVASPALDRMLGNTDGSPAPLKLDELGEPVLTRAFDRFRVEGYGIRHLTVDNRRYSSMAASLQSLVGRKWAVLITVPEDDFVGFLDKNIQRALILSSIAFGMVALMVGLLVAQSLAAERTAKKLADRKRRMEAQSRAFAKLTSLASLYDTGDDESLDPVAEIVCQTMDIRRVSLWRMVDDGNHLLCLDSFDRESNGHTRGAVLERQDFPLLFEAISGGQEIETTDVESNPPTMEISKAYLKPLSCCALLAVPVRLADRIGGCVWFEHDGRIRGWSGEDLNLARSIAGILAIRIGMEGGAAASQDVAGSSAEPPLIDLSAAVEAEQATERTFLAGGLNQPLPPAEKLCTATVNPEALKDVLAGYGLDRSHLAAAIVDGVSVMVLQFTDPVPLAGPSADDPNHSVLEDTVCRVEQLAKEHGIEYLKLLGEQMVLATGFAGGASRHGQRIADAALDIQKMLMQLQAGKNGTVGFRMGLDMGTAFGTLAGEGRGCFNIWGNAVRTAAEMADTSLDGNIQVAEAAYRGLRDEYLFKQRGYFYVADLGEIQTYLLRGKL